MLNFQYQKLSTNKRSGYFAENVKDFMNRIDDVLKLDRRLVREDILGKLDVAHNIATLLGLCKRVREGNHWDVPE